MAETPSIEHHLQKLGSKVKCPLCLNLLIQPMLLPCDHIFCNFCVPRSKQLDACPICKHQYVEQELRAASHMESMVAIYKSLDAAFSANALQSFSPAIVSRSVDDNTNVEDGRMCCIAGREGIFGERDVKRQKKPNNGSSEMSLASHSHIPQRCHSSENIASSNFNFENQISKSPVSKPKAVSDQHLLKGSVCAFCHSSKTTEGTGPFLYFANGREVVGNVTSLSKVICVHSKCFNWTPQVFFDGDTVKNLETEVIRAAKLKCSSCGVKGAALGCYMTSCRRSYHVPCAFEIKDCRWDMDHFLMLCPIHKSVKFPNEKSKSRTRIRKEGHPETSPLSTEQLRFWANSSDGPRDWVLCGSALSSEEKFMLVSFANMCGATVCKFWKPNVTHVVAATDEKGACTRTLKVLMAILNGKWILAMDWVKACVAANGPVNEEHYEISLDNHGCSGGPKAGRLRASTNAPKLFDGLKFHLSGDFVPFYKSDLLDLVEKAGGIIMHSREQLVEQSHAAQETQPASLVVYNSDSPQDCTIEDESNILQKRLAEAEDLAKQSGCQVIQHTWILESIAACKVLPFF